jgi:DNA-binding CsgD family transcriptional regulator
MTPLRSRDTPTRSPTPTAAPGIARTAPTGSAPQTGELSFWFDADPAPVFLIGADAVVIQANPAARRLVEQGSCVSLRGRTLTFSETESNRSFLRSLAQVVARRASPGWTVLRGADGAWRTVDLLASDADSSRVFVCFRTEPQAEIDIDPLVSAFGLTMSEGEVLRRLTEGLSPKEIARRLSVSTNTVRAHLRTLYLKMRVRGIPGVIRQAMRLTR